MRDYRARLGRPFPHDKNLTGLTDLRDQLKAKLSGAGHESADEKGPQAIELAEQIKTLKAANTIEATPQRAQQKQAAAEEPVTARIRRRQEVLIAETSVQETLEPAADAMSFRERIQRERLRNAEGEGQSPS